MYDEDLVSDEDAADNDDDDASDDSDGHGLSLAARLMSKSGQSHAATIKALSCDVIELDDSLPTTPTPQHRQPATDATSDAEIEVLCLSGDTDHEGSPPHTLHSPLDLSFGVVQRMGRSSAKRRPTLPLDDDDDDDELPTVDLGFGSSSASMSFAATAHSYPQATALPTSTLLLGDADSNSSNSSSSPRKPQSKRAKAAEDRDARRLAKEAERQQKQAAKAAKAQERVASKQAAEHAKQTAKLERQLSKAKKPEERLHQMTVHIGADVLKVSSCFRSLPCSPTAVALDAALQPAAAAAGGGRRYRPSRSGTAV